MQAVIPPQNLKLLQRTLQCLGKIGDNLVIEANQSQFVLRTLSDSQAAYAQFYFNIKTFFSEYEFKADFHSQASHDYSGLNTQNTQSPNSLKVSLRVRSCQQAVRVLSNVKDIQIKIDPDQQQLIMCLRTSENIKRTYTFNFEEQPRILQAEMDVKSCRTKIMCSPMVFLKCLKNFSPNLQEITVMAKKESVRLQSYIDEGEAPTGTFLHTEQDIPRRDFDMLQVQGPPANGSEFNAELTFCMKEFKAMLDFCMYSSTDSRTQIHMHIQQIHGKPVLLTNGWTDESPVQAGLILATLRTDEEEDEEDDARFNDEGRAEANAGYPQTNAGFVQPAPRVQQQPPPHQPMPHQPNPLKRKRSDDPFNPSGFSEHTYANMQSIGAPSIPSQQSVRSMAVERNDVSFGDDNLSPIAHMDPSRPGHAGSQRSVSSLANAGGSVSSQSSIVPGTASGSAAGQPNTNAYSFQLPPTVAKPPLCDEDFQ